jgi:hypothetical protein
MKSIKMLGLAAFAALMAMAFLGASSAVAGNTQLCKADEEPCAAANVIAHIHKETVAGAPATVLTSLGNVTCNVLFLGDSLGLGAPLIIHGNFTYTGCLRNGNACTATEVSTSALIRVLKTAAETASSTIELEVNVHCGVFLNCTYNGEELVGTTKGPLLAAPNGEWFINEQFLRHVGGGICPATNKLDIRMTPLVATYIST